MSKHGTIRRYTLIIEKINRGQFPSFTEIKEVGKAIGEIWKGRLK